MWLHHVSAYDSCVSPVQVSLPDGKLLKITLANPDPRMKAGQIWSVTADLEENKLTIVEAVPITPIEKEAEPQPQPVVKTAARVEPTVPKPTAPTQKAIDALFARNRDY